MDTLKRLAAWIKRTWPIHSGYLLLCLLAVVIIQAAVEWSAGPDLAGKLIFGLTLTALIATGLSVIIAVFSASTSPA